MENQEEPLRDHKNWPNEEFEDSLPIPLKTKNDVHIPAVYTNNHITKEIGRSVISQASEKYERRYELNRHGYDLDRIIERMAEIYGMEAREILCKGKQERKIKARSLCCFWAVTDLGMSLQELARRLEMSPPAVGFSVERGKKIAHENGYGLLD